MNKERAKVMENARRFWFDEPGEPLDKEWFERMNQAIEKMKEMGKVAISSMPAYLWGQPGELRKWVKGKPIDGPF